MTWALRTIPQPLSPVSVDTQEQNFATTTDSEARLAEAQEALLSRARLLVNEQVYPRAPLGPYVNALRAVLNFVRTHERRFTEAHLSADMCSVMEGVALELRSLPHVPLTTMPPKPHSLQEIAATTAMLLRAYQDAVRRVVQGSHNMKVRAAFGLSESIQPNQVDQVVEAIGLFLAGSKRYPLFLKEAGLSVGQLRGLRIQQQVLRAWLSENQTPTIPSMGALEQVRVLHAAVEYFFDRFAAIVSARFLDLPEERLRGLQLVPRKPNLRQERRRISMV